ncbi:MAG TPA: hypothetical protein VN726_02715 [Hanamia sp.]|nr:hypothetical protein [Hanamia sp.]
MKNILTFFRQAKCLHNFPDPAKAKGSEEEIMKKFREVRAMIKTYCSNFIDDNL